MRLNRLGAFTLGVVITAVSVSAVSIAAASGGDTIQACANKKTGNMRYITRGSCSKAEQTLSWNKTGPQGLPGSPGVAGAAGARDAQGLPGNPGATGAAGPVGASGASGNSRIILGNLVGSYWIEKGTTCAINISNQGNLTSDTGTKFSICGLALNDVTGSPYFGYAESMRAMVP